MPKYRALARSYIGKLVEPGEIIEWDGDVGSNLEPLDAAAKAKADETRAKRKDRATREAVRKDPAAQSDQIVNTVSTAVETAFNALSGQLAGLVAQQANPPAGGKSTKT